jgi:hypothetical protein
MNFDIVEGFSYSGLGSSSNIRVLLDRLSENINDSEDIDEITQFANVLNHMPIKIRKELVDIILPLM